MKIIECIHTESRCYKTAQKANPIGIVVHSTGANQTALARYVQPSKDDKNRDELLSIIGKNRYGNHWNRDISKAVHYMIGKLVDGTVGIAHLLPEEICAWGVGSGKKGSYNYPPVAHIQFEICEDGLTDETYFRECYNAAVSLCADICRRWGWEASVIVSHKEACKKGYASNHADCDHWLKKFGLTMDNFRADVDKLLHPVEEKEDEVVVFEKGDKVKIADGATWWTGKSIPKWVMKKTLFVREIQKKNGKYVYVLSTYKTVPVYTGKVYADAIKKA